MSNEILKDDEKFKELIGKQKLVDSEPKDDLEKLDEKMDDMMMVQSISEEGPKYESVEEKYEIELFLEDFGNRIMVGFEDFTDIENEDSI